MSWDEFMEKERASLERRKSGELASMLGGPQQGESLEYLRRLADEDRGHRMISGGLYGGGSEYCWNRKTTR